MFIHFIKLDKLLHLFIFYVVSWFDKNKGLLSYVLLAFHLLYTFSRSAAAAVWCNIYLKHVFGTCYIISLLFPFILFMALENLHLLFLYVAFCITLIRVVDTKLHCDFFLGIKCFLWIFKVSPRVIVQVRIYLWQLSYSTKCIYVAMTWRCCSPAWPPLNEKRIKKKKKSHIKEGGALEHTHRLHNRHGPMVAQRCLGAKTNSPESLLCQLFRTAETNSKLTYFQPDFVWNYVISVCSSI